MGVGEFVCGFCLALGFGFSWFFFYGFACVWVLASYVFCLGDFFSVLHFAGALVDVFFVVSFFDVYFEFFFSSWHITHICYMWVMVFKFFVYICFIKGI